MDAWFSLLEEGSNLLFYLNDALIGWKHEHDSTASRPDTRAHGLMGRPKKLQ